MQENTRPEIDFPEHFEYVENPNIKYPTIKVKGQNPKHAYVTIVDNEVILFDFNKNEVISRDNMNFLNKTLLNLMKYDVLYDGKLEVNKSIHTTDKNNIIFNKKNGEFEINLKADESIVHTTPVERTLKFAQFGIKKMTQSEQDRFKQFQKDSASHDVVFGKLKGLDNHHIFFRNNTLDSLIELGQEYILKAQDLKAKEFKFTGNVNDFKRYDKNVFRNDIREYLKTPTKPYIIKIFDEFYFAYMDRDKYTK